MRKKFALILSLCLVFASASGFFAMAQRSRDTGRIAPYIPEIDRMRDNTSNPNVPYIALLTPEIVVLGRCEGRCLVDIIGRNFTPDARVFLQRIVAGGGPGQRTLANSEFISRNLIRLFIDDTGRDTRFKVVVSNSAGESNAHILNIIGSEPETGGGGEVVAVMTTEAPEQQSFLLHGTFPIPKGTLLPNSNIEPFKVKDSDGTVLEAQTEAVTWYANVEQDGAAVVEILANVSRPSGSAGQMIDYEVIYDPAPGTPNPRGDAIQMLTSNISLPQNLLNLLQPGKIQIRTKDAFGNAYTMDPLLNGTVTLLKAGNLIRQVKIFNLIRPEDRDAPNAAPNLFGIDTYLQVRKGSDILLVDMRFSNSNCNLGNSSDCVGASSEMFFTNIEARLAHDGNWRVVINVEDPSFDGTAVRNGEFNTFQIVKTFANRKMQVMQYGAQGVRRLAIAPENSRPKAEAILQNAGLGFVEDATNENGERLWSWWNPQTSAYYPYMLTLPTLEHLGSSPNAAKQNIRNDLKGKRNFLKGIIESGGVTYGGLPPVPYPACGWHHTYGSDDPLAPGGQEIHWFEGSHVAYSASREGAENLFYIFSMRGARQDNNLVKPNGKPVEKRDVLAPCPDPDDPRDYQKLRISFTTLQPLGGLDNTPCHFNAPISQAHRNYVIANNLLPDCYANLVNHMPIVEESHWGRWGRTILALMYQTNDSLVKDTLRNQAFLKEMAATTSPELKWTGECANTLPGSLAKKMDEAQQNPNHAIDDFDRFDGWRMNGVSASYQAHLEDRHKLRYWFDYYVDLANLAQIQGTGVFNADENPHLPGYGQAMYFHESYVKFGLWGILENVYSGGVNPEKAALIKEILLKGTVTTTHPDYQGDGEQSCSWPVWRFGSYPLDDPDNLFCPGTNPVPEEAKAGACDAARIVAPGVLAYAITLDPDNPIYLNAYSGMVNGATLLEATQNEIHLDSDNYENEFMMMLGILQEREGEGR